jgi:oleate hydratase
MLTTDNYECTWDLFKSIPSLQMELHTSCITDWLSPEFFETPFWYMWATTFAFQPWHSAIEFKRYLHRFMLEFTRIETLAGVKRTIYNQYDSLVRPLQVWLESRGVRLKTQSTVTAVDHQHLDGRFMLTRLHVSDGASATVIDLGPADLVFIQNGSMTDSSSLGSMTAPPPQKSNADTTGWRLWEDLAAGRPQFGRPAAFNDCIAQSCWESFTVTLTNSTFFNKLQDFSGNEAGTGGLVTFKDSNWLMSIVLAHQPHFIDQPDNVQVFWGYGLFPDRVGNFVAKRRGDRGPPVACSRGRQEPRLRESIRRNRRRRGIYRGVFCTRRADGGLPTIVDRSTHPASDSPRHVLAHAVRCRSQGVCVGFRQSGSVVDLLTP